jgi:glucose-6-phosphate isomerase
MGQGKDIPGWAPFDFDGAARRVDLEGHAARLREKGLVDLQQDSGRVDRWVLSPDGLGWRFDFTKQLIDGAAWDGLRELAEAANWEGARDAQFAGHPINETEGRAVLHMALRGSAEDTFAVDGEPVMEGVLSTREAFLDFADAVREGRYTTASGGRFTHVVNIGIGGSDLGPVMVHEALAPQRAKEGAPLEVRFVSNVDPFHLDQALQGCEADSTLVVIVSKTFTTQETMANAERALSWLRNELGDRAGSHLAAVTSNVEGAARMGIEESRVFGFGNWVGGRFSLWGPVGLAIALGSGGKAFRALLDGARAMDRHFQTADAEANVPLHMALIEIWNVNALGLTSRAVLPYAQALHRVPAYLQQAEMESNGKAVGRDGRPVRWATHPVVWGEPGTNGQHAFHQLLHQGTNLHPVEFIAARQPQGGDGHMHRLLLANAVAQAEAFCVGRTEDEVRAEMAGAGHPSDFIDKVAPHRTFAGGRPSTFCLAEELDARSLGALIAVYEHKIFLEGILWNVFSYDQWGVELGKVLARQLLVHGAEGDWTPGTCSLLKAL